jgi:hypothetical protein
MVRHGVVDDRAGTPEHASLARPTCSDSTTCARDPGRRIAPFGKQRNNSASERGRPGLVVHGSRAAGKAAEKKTVCPVTTVGRYLLSARWLSRGLGALAPLPFGLGVLGLRLRLAPAAGLTLTRLPTTDQPQAYRILAIALVPTAGLVATAATLAQANPHGETRSPSVTMRVRITLRRTHGRCHSQRLTRGGGGSPPSRGFLSKQDRDDRLSSVKSSGGTRQGSRPILERLEDRD